MAGKESTFRLKQRIEELEKQVNEYKQKLESLRKAKNTTITKREREVLEIKGPNLGQRAANDLKIVELQKQLMSLEKSKGDEVANLSKQLSEQLEALKLLQNTAQVSSASDEEELERLRAENAALRFDNDELRHQVDTFHMELSIKEAEWCDREEKYKSQLEKSWGEKYAEWMAKTEQKMEELQQANVFLRQMLDAHKPQS